MSTNRFLTLINGVPRLVRAIASSVGSADADKIVSTGSNGRLSLTLLPDNVLNFIADPPSSPSSSGVKGQASLSTEYFYICISENTWRRFAISTWVPSAPTNDLTFNGTSLTFNGTPLTFN